ncbi:MAG: ADP-ribosylglycohydrolase family protein [Candidatus Izemoplasmatales bacterium]
MKKAWETAYELLHGSIPVVLSEDEQAWKGIEAFEKMTDLTYRMKWHSNVPGSGAPESVIAGAVQSMENMGYDVSEAEQLLEEGRRAFDADDMRKLIPITCRLWNLFGRMASIPHHPYRRHAVYDTFEQYHARAVLPPRVAVDPATPGFRSRTRHGWLAQIVGGAFGTALEGYVTANLRTAFGEIRDYVRTPNTYNDDITYELAFLDAYRRAGRRINSEDVALAWVGVVPFGWSAEEIALKNIAAGIMPPKSGHFNNPYREWIGAQMRGAICGMLSPGDAAEAARLAFVDGAVSHSNNGILGEVFNAVMTSLAYVETDVRRLVEACVAAIPDDSEYHAVVSRALSACRAGTDWESTWEELEPEFKTYNWIHSYPNAAAEVVALWFGNGDFDETMHAIGMIGYDVDCNAAQIMTAVAIMNDAVPRRWSDPIGTEIVTYCRGMKKMTIDSLTDDTIAAIDRS